MIINFDAELLDLDGKPIKQDPSEHSPAATLKHVTLLALQSGSDPQRQDDAAKKVRCFEIMVKANRGGCQELSVEDVALVKEKVALVYPPLVVGTSFRLLEG